MFDSFTVKEITAVYRRTHINWQRDKAAPRKFYAVVFFEEGQIVYYYPNKTLTAKKGDILFLPRDVAYSGKKLSNSVSYYVIDFAADPAAGAEVFSAASTVAVPDSAQGCAWFQQALELYSDHAHNGGLKLKALLYEILSRLFAPIQGESAVNRNTQILFYVKEHFCDPSLNVPALCKQFFISEAQLRRVVKQYTGVSPNRYLLSLRLAKARTALATTDDAIKTVADSCGFSSAYYFTRCFTASEGVSPTAYRIGTRI